MNMTPRLQKLTLYAHIAFSVGWFGAVVPYVALAIAALTSHDAMMTRAACLSMEAIGWFVIVPFSLAALLSGLVQALGTQWGLFRRWWILAKLALTLFAVAVLLEHMRDVSRVSRLAENSTAFVSGQLRPELIHSAGGLLVLLVIMTLSVLKPWGMTPYGRGKSPQAKTFARQSVEAAIARDAVFIPRAPQWKRIIGFHALALVVLVAILHITGLHHH